MLWTFKEQTAHLYFYQTHTHLRKHLEAFIKAYNFAKGRKALPGRSPVVYVCDGWRECPAICHRNPNCLSAETKQLSPSEMRSIAKR